MYMCTVIVDKYTKIKQLRNGSTKTESTATECLPNGEKVLSRYDHKM
ncbi:hypothetical protein DOY81_007061 [Sarcophaga bullata]|nr:hypothetical protein DOY81_007061 [Sarcophaga bullata]